MRKTLVAAFSVAALVVCGAFAAPASAESRADNCHAVASFIASTWPWAHEGKPAVFQPPPGVLKLWFAEFAPDQFPGVDSIPELQEVICSGE
jgi:hypothetical protein